MPTPRKGLLLTLFWRVHRLAFRASGGRLGASVVGLPVLELTTAGRRSGTPRSVLLNYLDDPDGYLVVASNAGDRRHPSWWLNLEAQPTATVRIGKRRETVRAEEVAHSEYPQLWSRFVGADPGYGDYAAWTDRHIPIIRLRTEAA